MRPSHSPWVFTRIRLALLQHTTGFDPSAEIRYIVLTPNHESVTGIFDPGARRQPTRFPTADANGIPEAFLPSWRER